MCVKRYSDQAAGVVDVAILVNYVDRDFILTTNFENNYKKKKKSNRKTIINGASV